MDRQQAEIIARLCHAMVNNGFPIRDIIDEVVKIGADSSDSGKVVLTLDEIDARMLKAFVQNGPEDETHDQAIMRETIFHQLRSQIGDY